MIKAIVQLGENFGKSITVEGVKYEYQAEILKELGCKDFQGFLYSKPVSGTKITEFLSLG